MENIVDLICECGRVYCRPINDDMSKNEIVGFTCECGNKMDILIAERVIK